jgi:hypothetical protein
MTNERDGPPKDDYKFGYRHPPQHSRFKAGRSGNPSGRPQGSKNFSTLFAEELARPVTLTENGKRKKMPKRQALAKQMINKALSSDPKATALVVDQIRRGEGLTEASAQTTIEVCRSEDKLVIENIIRRIRTNQDAYSETAAIGDTNEETK